MNGKKGKMGKKGTASTQPPSESSSTAMTIHDDDFDLTVSMTIGKNILKIDVDKKLHIPSIDVLTPQKACNMMAENPAVHARWNVLANQAAVRADYEKIKFEIWVKEQSRTYRSELAEASGKRVTDKQVEEAVLTDPEYARKYRTYLKKREDAANLKSIAIGFAERGERLVNIVSMMKWEKPSSVVKGDKKVYTDDDETEKNAFSDNEDDD